MSEFRIGEQVYVKGKTPKDVLGSLYRVFTTVVSKVVDIKDDKLKLQICDYTCTIPSEYCIHYIPKIDIVRERRKWAWLDEYESAKKTETAESAEGE